MLASLLADAMHVNLAHSIEGRGWSGGCRSLKGVTPSRWAATGVQRCRSWGTSEILDAKSDLR